MKGERNANGGRRMENEIWDNYRFILSVRASHFRSVSKIVSIPEYLGHRCDWRTCRSRRGILDASRKFHRRIFYCAWLLIGCHSILCPSVSRLRVTSHVLWQHLHASYPSRTRGSVDSNLAAAREVLRVVDEPLMNLVNFHVDDPSLINGRSNWLQEGHPKDDGGLLMRIHIYNHEINHGWRILELKQHILCDPVGLHYSGVCQSQLMRGRDQWVLILAVMDHLGQGVHASFVIAERMMDLDWPQDARNCGECWST
jgi:hypothetical protein